MVCLFSALSRKVGSLQISIIIIIIVGQMSLAVFEWVLLDSCLELSLNGFCWIVVSSCL